MKVFFMDPNYPIRPPREMEATIIVREKASWAVMPNGKRRLVGATIFFTLASANRSRRGALQKLVEDPFIRSSPYTRNLYDGARAALKQLKGVVH